MAHVHFDAELLQMPAEGHEDRLIGRSSRDRKHRTCLRPQAFGPDVTGEGGDVSGALPCTHQVRSHLDL